MSKTKAEMLAVLPHPLKDVYHQGLNMELPEEDHDYEQYVVIPLSKKIYTLESATKRIQELLPLRKLRLVDNFQTAAHFCYKCMRL